MLPSSSLLITSVPMNFGTWRSYFLCFVVEFALLGSVNITVWLCSCSEYVPFLATSSQFLSSSCFRVSIFHCSRSIYWWWRSSSPVVSGKRWTNHPRETKRFFLTLSLLSLLFSYDPFLSSFTLVLSLLNRRFAATVCSKRTLLLFSFGMTFITLLGFVELSVVVCLDFYTQFFSFTVTKCLGVTFFHRCAL